jgi:hypothetical protein
MNPAVLQQTIINGFPYCDHSFWNYSEAPDWLTPGAVSSDWVNAVWNARTALGLPPPGDRTRYNQ